MANLLSWLGNQIHGIEAQINPWDNGQNYNSVVNRQPVPQRPQQRPQPPQQRQQAPRPSSNNALLAPIQAAELSVPRPKVPTTQPNQTLQALENTAKDLVLGAESTGQKVLNTTGAAAAGIGGASQALYHLATGNRPAAEADNTAALARVNQYLNRKTVTGDQGAFLTPSQAAGKGNVVSDFVKPVISTAAEVAPYVTPGGVVTKGVSLPVKAATGAVVNAGVSGGTNIMSQLANTGRIDPAQAAKATLLGGVVGGAVPLVGAGGRKLVTGAQEPAIKAAEQVSGLPRTHVLNDNEAYTLSDFADVTMGRTNVPAPVRNQITMQARNAAKTAGIDIIKGSRAEVDRRIASYLEARDAFKNAHQTMSQGGYAKIPGGQQLLPFNEPSAVSGEPNPVSKLPGEVRYAAQDRTNVPGTELPQSVPGTFLPMQSVAGTGVNIPEQPRLQPQKASSQIQRLESPTSVNSTPVRGFVQSVATSPEVSPTVRGRAAGTYTVRNTKALEAKAQKFAAGNLAKASETVSKALAAKTGHIGDNDVANAIAVAKRFDSNNGHAQATDIYERLAEHLTRQGQSIQAASLLDHRTPEGLRYQITKTFKKANVKPTAEVNAKIDEAFKQIKSAKPGTPEHIYAVKSLQKIVADNLPSGIGEKGIAIWKAGLLSGARTQTGNILSNETFSTFHNLSNPLAAGLDKLISLKTGQRTKTLTPRGFVSGTELGVKQAGRYLKTGIDERSPLTNKFEANQVNFKNKALNTYVNGIFKIMGAADRPHYYRQLHMSLNDMALADAKNRGLSGAKLASHIKNFVENPPEQAIQVATNEAEKAVLGNETILSRAVSYVRKAADDAESPLGKSVTEAAINIIAPFTKVPSAFISRVVDFSPVGAIKTIAGQISRKQFDQRALVTALSEATTGTSLMYLGKTLADNSMLSGNYPSDSKEQQRWKADGIQPNSIKVGDQWLSLNYFGPVGLLFGMGGRISDAKKKGQGFLGQQFQGFAGLPKDLSEQSFLQGLNNGMQALNEPGRYLENFAKSQISSVIPTLSNDIATAIDPKQRQSDSVPDAVRSRIPVLRQGLNPAQDVYGNTLDRKTSALGTLVNPFRPSQAITNNVKSEVDRLHSVDPNNKDLSITPTTIDKSIQVNKQTVNLTDQQRYDLQKKVGQAVQDAWGKLIQTPEYKALDDTGKAKALSNLRTDVSEFNQRQFMMSNNLATYDKPLSARASAAATGNLNASRYTSPSSSKGTTATTPAEKYKAAQDKFNTDQSTMSDIQKYSAQQSLNKLKVASDYSQDVINLYNMSKENAYSYLTSHPNTDKLAQDLVQYDNALYDAGLSKYKKYQTGLAPKAKKAKSAKAKAGTTKGRAQVVSANRTSQRLRVPKIKSLASSAPKIPKLRKSTSKKYAVPKSKIPTISKRIKVKQAIA